MVSISGDGGFGQYMAEVTTAVKYGMKITHGLLNNSQLGKISKEQRSGGWHVWQTSLCNPNFADFAESCGALGIRVEDEAALADALDRALAHQGFRARRDPHRCRARLAPLEQRRRIECIK